MNLTVTIYYTHLSKLIELYAKKVNVAISMFQVVFFFFNFSMLKNIVEFKEKKVG